MLRRRVEADVGGSYLRITDTVTNIGPTACHMLLYRSNVGSPSSTTGRSCCTRPGTGPA